MRGRGKREKGTEKGGGREAEIRREEGREEGREEDKYMYINSMYTGHNWALDVK